jgi:hypothetical protein
MTMIYWKGETYWLGKLKDSGVPLATSFAYAPCRLCSPRF